MKATHYAVNQRLQFELVRAVKIKLNFYNEKLQDEMFLKDA
eukprot:CAMPEP_0197295894 /NCGR_PEP_ID=MMETSP0890-20130614/36855_1 /TAXON_ID=44058 ORGANISM="Aureoumbra lagunensis, Strain CCMP1510" /NCGR_SAMPLE_ID=MMETSP0890 /ASSEMBLY_ACC=CAM_ASM_000533 /LENGTH=40 /DNA_ID= /DNA_START= /DNA_END= /DNA_ORIENTATION=